MEHPRIVEGELEIRIIGAIIKNAPGVTNNEIRKIMIEFCRQKNYCWTRCLGMEHPIKKLENRNLIAKVKVKGINYYFWKIK